jgi:hypothetical protein
MAVNWAAGVAIWLLLLLLLLLLLVVVVVWQLRGCCHDSCRAT